MSKTDVDPRDRILGAWKLLSFDIKSDNSPDAKTILQLYGPNPLGRIFFTPEGYMSAILTNPDSAKNFEPKATLLNSPDKDVAAAARSFASYCVSSQFPGASYPYISLPEIFLIHPQKSNADSVNLGSL
jgi:hypothetical protein